MIKLLYITNGIDGSGGLERVLSIKASYLADHYNYEVTILCLNGHHQNPFYEFSPNIKTLSIDVSGNSLAYLSNYIKGIKSAIKRINPDVISVCDDGLKGFMIPQFIGNKTPIIYERHASIQLNFNKASSSGIKVLSHKAQAALMKLAATKFDRFVVLTSGNLKEWKTGNLQVIPNPLSFNPQTIPMERKKSVIAVGSHSFNKGYDLLLKSWEKVYTNFPEWKLLIYGRKDEEKTYVNLAQQMGLSESVVFNDPVQDIESVYKEASILALPSRSEGFGMVLIEAMACGLPCVSFDCPHGPGDIVTDGEDGFLVENGNWEDFAEKLSVLMDNRELNIRMGIEGRRNAKAYLPEKIVPKWDSLFNSLLQ